ncbi:MAG: hypothetical protein ACI4M6_01480 [Christensenellaceae bacterium]
MKKLTTLICALIFVFSVVTFSACDKKENNSEISESSVEYTRSKNNSSSLSVINSSSKSLVIPSDILGDSSSSKSSSEANKSSSDSASSSSDNGSTETSSKSNEPSSSNAQNSSSTAPDSSAPNSSDEPDSSQVNQKVLTAISRIDNIGTITQENYTQKAQLIEYAEQAYNALTAEEKELVTNSQKLFDARTLYDAYLAQDNQKAVETFKTLMANIGEYSYTAEFKTKLDNATAEYNKLTASQQSLVASEKTKLDALTKKYNDEDAYRSFMTAYTVLKDVAINDSNVGEFRKVISGYNALTSDQKALITDAAVASNIAQWQQTIKDNYSQVLSWVWQTDKVNSKNGFTVAKSGTYENSAGVTYNGTNLTKAIKISNATFAAPYGGVLRVYCKNLNNASITLNLSVGGTTVSSQTVATGVLEFQLDGAGTYVLTPSNASNFALYALEFSA